MSEAQTDMAKDKNKDKNSATQAQTPAAPAPAKKATVKVEKVNPELLAQAIEALGDKITIPEGADVATKADLLNAYMVKNNKLEETVQCDVCGGFSGTDYDQCPFCGSGDETSGDALDTSAPPEDSGQTSEGDTVSAEDAGGEETETPAGEGSDAPSGEKPKRGRPKKETAIEVIPEGVTVEALDSSITQIQTLKSAAASSYWALGNEIARLHEGQLWKARRNEDGSPKHKNFNSFCAEELGMSYQNAYNLIDVAKNFSEEKVKAFGTGKLSLLLKAPPEAREELEKEVEAGLSKHDLEKKVTEKRGEAAAKGTATKGETGRKARGTGKGAQKESISIATILGAQQIPMFKPVKKGQKAEEARTLADKPSAVLDLPNGVRMFFQVVENAKGDLQLKINTKRVEG